MKSPLAQELSNILSTLRKQNRQIDKTIRYLNRTKSLENIHRKNIDAVNPESKTVKKIAKPSETDKKPQKKSKSFYRCHSCQFKEEDCSTKNNFSIFASPKINLQNKARKNAPLSPNPAKKISTKQIVSPHKNMTPTYFALLSNRKHLKQH